MKIAEFYHFKPILIVLILLCLVSSCYSAGTMRGIHLDRIQLPPGFKIRLYAAEESVVAGLIRSSGYYNIKAKRLKAFLRFLQEGYAGNMEEIISRAISSINSVERRFRIGRH